MRIAKRHEAICQRCGEPFQAARKTAKYCSPACRQPRIRSEKAYQKAMRKISRTLDLYRYQFDRDCKRLFAFTEAWRNAPDISKGQAAVTAYWARLIKNGDTALGSWGEITHNTLSVGDTRRGGRTPEPDRNLWADNAIDIGKASVGDWQGEPMHARIDQRPAK